ncbi:MAG: PAS domain S-box protein [Flavobacterium sp.]|nr:PAS domain S-box protein [Flavobacterium sp.]MDD3004761.1 PAS domain S-box protein [Flavobacterium sp.]
MLYSKEFKVLALNSTAKILYKRVTGGNLGVGSDMRTSINPKNVDTFYQFTSKALNGEKTIMEYYNDGNSEARWLNYTVLPVYNDNDKSLIGIMWIIKDIHTEKMLELKLREDEMKFRSLFEEAPVPIIIVDETAKIVDANKETSFLFGYAPTELIGQSLNILIPERFNKSHDSHYAGYMKHPRPYKMGVGRLIPALLKNGQEITVEVSLNSFTSFDKKYATAIIQDVSKRIEHEQAVEEHFKQLRDIASFQSHEVRHPLANILGLTKFINEEKSYDELSFRYLEMEANNLDNVIRKTMEIIYKKNL